MPLFLVGSRNALERDAQVVVYTQIYLQCSTSSECAEKCEIFFQSKSQSVLLQKTDSAKYTSSMISLEKEDLLSKWLINS